MQKELLLAIGDERTASYTLRFLEEVFENFCDLKLTLFYVAPRKASWAIDEQDLVPRGKGYDEMEAHTRTRGVKAVDDALNWIRDIAGCTGNNVETKVVHSRKGTVRELVDEARSGLYDALVLGKRAMTWFDGVFENSVCHEMLWQDIDFPIWICRQPPARPRHDILLCLDGSEASLRMVDHAGYMLAEEERHTFTLFHVAQSYRDRQASAIFESALAQLTENGVAEERIEMKLVTGGNPVKATIQEAAEGRYSAVGVGRHCGAAQGRMEAMFPSSVTVRLLRQMKSSALWISK
ncbi:universal stress protein [Pseudodesulfovibrio sp.]|uniref:universal stress protein n=1 Tax=Pseudodesulfovibrio sp. TaxID=2035812 RepID=UPI0026091956|nr:universal stress protein [Pseudodesulfovibrio sp.]MDD3312550.1 universal stress protein [Pseudodesulfovibrio sp.]